MEEKREEGRADGHRREAEVRKQGEETHRHRSRRRQGRAGRARRGAGRGQ